MKKLFHRSCRISQELQKKIAFIIQYSLRDPRIDIIKTVSEVQLSKDLSHAKVFISFLKNNNTLLITNNLKILNKASGYIRKLLFKTMKLRISPHLVFYHDDSSLKGDKISLILKKLTEKTNNNVHYEQIRD